MTKLIILLLFPMLLLSCNVPHQLTVDEEIFSLLDEYKKQSEALKQYQASQKEKGIHRAEIANPSVPLDQQLVSVELENAYLAVVIERLGVSYSLTDLTSITGRVTEKFEKRPMQQAMDLLLAPAQLQARIGEHRVIISRALEIVLEPAPGKDFVFIKQVLRYADTRSLEPILSAVLGSNDNGDDDDDDDDDDGSSGSSKSLSFAAINSENAILIKGPSADVRNAVEILKSLDTDSGHILIEALVLEFSAEHLLGLGTRISSGAIGHYLSFA